MPYRSGKEQTLVGRHFGRGDVVPPAILAAIPRYRFGALTRTGLLVEEITMTGSAANILGEMCSVCGEGPFTRLARHMTARHESTEDLAILAETTEPIDELVGS